MRENTRARALARVFMRRKGGTVPCEYLVVRILSDFELQEWCPVVLRSWVQRNVASH